MAMGEWKFIWNYLIAAIYIFISYFLKLGTSLTQKFQKKNSSITLYHWTNTVSRNTSEPEYFVLHFEGRHPLSLSTTTRVSGWTPESTERVKTLRRSATSWYSRPSPLTVITNLQQITSMEHIRNTFVFRCN